MMISRISFNVSLTPKPRRIVEANVVFGRDQSASEVAHAGVRLRKCAKPLDGAATHGQPQSR
ncbi:hypothetical protein [Azospirillum brasilense]|uniref:hypothetical protein n=1 Tax=Azospirillum brasilense TaxID=192 RepID=UPI001178A75A|nr:hypothetical protein [Azospirillum brasilense]